LESAALKFAEKRKRNLVGGAKNEVQKRAKTERPVFLHAKDKKRSLVT
jgi:hypothetical protein